MRRRNRPPKPRPAHWLISESWTHMGRERQKGDEFTFTDVVRTKEGNILRRRAKFIEHVVNRSNDAEWVTAREITSDGEARGVRSLHPDQIGKWWKVERKQPSRKAKRKKQREA